MLRLCSRCDVLSSDGDKTVCQHCKQYGFECTFFLPITETRFKKKRLEEEAAAAAAAAATAEKKGEQKPEIVNDQEITRRIDGEFIFPFTIFPNSLSSI